GFSDGTPMSVNAVNRDYMVGIVFGFEIKNEWRKAIGAQRGGGEDRSFQAVSRIFSQHPPRRPRGVGQVIWNVVEKTLDAVRRLQAAEPAQFRCSEAGVTVVHELRAVYPKLNCRTGD